MRLHQQREAVAQPEVAGRETRRRDAVVDPGNSARLGRQIAEAGGEATVRFYARVDHASILGTFSPALRLLAPVFRDTCDFIDAVTGARPREAQAA